MSKAKIANFQNDLKWGLEKQLEFVQNFPCILYSCEGTGPDFYLYEGNPESDRPIKQIFVELKTDNHTTGNFFMERFSDVVRETPGGPWQALGKGSQLFIYWFCEWDEYYIFRTDELVKFLDELIEKRKQREVLIQNQGYSSMGYAIPIKDLRHLACGLNESTLHFWHNVEWQEDATIKNPASPEENDFSYWRQRWYDFNF